MVFRGAGVALLAAMVALERYASIWWVMVPIYVARTACINCTYPLQVRLPC